MGRSGDDQSAGAGGNEMRMRMWRWVGGAGVAVLALATGACGTGPAPKLSTPTTAKAIVPLTTPTTTPQQGVLAAYRADLTAANQAGIDLAPGELTGYLTGKALEFSSAQITTYRLMGDTAVGSATPHFASLKLISYAPAKSVVQACIDGNLLIEHGGTPVAGYQGAHTWDLLISTMTPDNSGYSWLISSSTGMIFPYSAGHPCGA